MGIIDTTSRGGINFGEEERESETAEEVPRGLIGKIKIWSKYGKMLPVIKLGSQYIGIYYSVTLYMFVILNIKHFKEKFSTVESIKRINWGHTLEKTTSKIEVIDKIKSWFNKYDPEKEKTT